MQLSKTRSIGNVRIHVELVIRNIRKKYSLLSDTQPIDFVISADNKENYAGPNCYCIVRPCKYVIPLSLLIKQIVNIVHIKSLSYMCNVKIDSLS